MWLRENLIETKHTSGSVSLNGGWYMEQLVLAVKIANPCYNKHGTIDADILHPQHGWIPFTASPDDPVDHGRFIWEHLTDPKNGWEIAPYVKPQEEIEAEVQSARDQELAEIDKIATNAILWGELPEEEKAKLVSRRKALSRHSGLMDQLNTAYDAHVSGLSDDDAISRADAAKVKVLCTIPTITDPESYDVEIAFRAHLRSQP